MGREVRKVPADWQHPKEHNLSRGKDEYFPLHYRGFAEADAKWSKGYSLWQEGAVLRYNGETEPRTEEHGARWTEYHGPRPSPDDYMPEWPDDQRTHLMMYEDTTEGTPISPAFETPEELARWLADNGASSFGGDTATYEQWLPVCRGGWAPSMVMQGGKIMSGVEFLSENPS